MSTAMDETYEAAAKSDRLRLVEPLDETEDDMADLPSQPESTVEPVVIEAFDRKKIDEVEVAKRLGVLVGEATVEYRRGIAAKHGDVLDYERLLQRRLFVVRAMREFGMLDELRPAWAEKVVLTDAAEAHAATGTKKDFDPSTIDIPKLADAEVAKTFYDDAEKAAQDMPRAEINDLIDARFSHPLIRTANSWVRTNGEPISSDAVLIMRATAVLLESLGEPTDEELAKS